MVLILLSGYDEEVTRKIIHIRPIEQRYKHIFILVLAVVVVVVVLLPSAKVAAAVTH
jgi:hypothetical protein